MSAPRPSRRSILRASALALACAGGAPLLGSCTSGPATQRGTGASGGTLRAAFVGGGAAETLNHLKGATALDYVRARSRHAALGAVDPAQPDGVRYDALDMIEVSDDLATYTLRVRAGQRFTDGAPVTARDVLYSLRAPVTLDALPFLKVAAAAFDLDAARVENDATLVLPARAPLVDGRLILCQSNLVFPEGTTEFAVDMPTCGPFRMTAFDPGQGASFERNQDYQAPDGSAGPFLDGLELRSIASSEARANALGGGQIDFADNLAPTTARTVQGREGIELVQSELPFVNQLSFALNVAQPPFGDPRVREAFKLAVDRRRIVDTVFFGRAVVGNDLPSIGFPGYADDLAQRRRDLVRARQLLREAGAEGLTVTLTTGPEIPGMVETATLFVEDLAEVGVRITLDELPPGQLFADQERYTRLPLAGGYNPPQPVLQAYTSTRRVGTPSNFGFDRPDIDALVATARGSRDPRERARALAEAQQLQWAEGNLIIPVFTPAVSGQRVGVQGVRYEPFANFASAALR